jgi:NAD+ kinase
MKKKLSLKRIAIVFNPKLEDSIQTAEIVAAYLEQHGAETTECGSLYDAALRDKVQNGAFDVLIALGGDGTILRASHLCAPFNVPIVGINFGTFGFLIELQKIDWQKHLKRILSGDYRLEQRMMLRAEHHRGKKRLDSWEVVNEVVVCRGQYVRPIRIHAAVDGFPMASYVADGLIASTPTGSTAYALAAGGAIMPPELRNIIIVPVAPHLSFDHSIILPEGVCVTISVNTSHQAVLSVDGHPPVSMKDSDCVRVSASDGNVHFIRFQDPGFFYRNLNRYIEQNPSIKRGH